MEKKYADLAERLHKILKPYRGELSDTDMIEIEILTLHLHITYHDGFHDGLATAQQVVKGT